MNEKCPACEAKEICPVCGNKALRKTPLGGQLDMVGFPKDSNGKTQNQRRVKETFDEQIYHCLVCLSLIETRTRQTIYFDESRCGFWNKKE